MPLQLKTVLIELELKFEIDYMHCIIDSSFIADLKLYTFTFISFLKSTPNDLYEKQIMDAYHEYKYM